MSSPELIGLVCPTTKIALEPVTREVAEQRMRGILVAREEAPNAKGQLSRPFGLTAMVLLREDLLGAYPIVDGVPILLAPEMLTLAERRTKVNLCQPQYAEAYEEMTHYSEGARAGVQNVSNSGIFATIAPVLTATPAEIASFPAPREKWIDAVYDCAAQWDAYQFLGPPVGKNTMQIGGKGSHAVKLLLAGAAEAWVVTPMLGELLFSRALAKTVGVVDRLRLVVAVAEEMPFADGRIDLCYSGGCVHHMQTALAFPEIARILRSGGRFAAADPWRAPLYAIGTWLFGKREPSVYCKPLNSERVDPLKRAFSKSSTIQHGTLTRYLLLALNKLGLNFSLKTAWLINSIDDAICSLIPKMRSMGSSVVLLAEK